MKRFLAVLFVILLFFSVFRSLNNKGRLSLDYFMTVLKGISVNIDMSEFAACVSDIGNFFTNFTGQFPKFEADNVFDAIKSTAVYIKTFMEMFANFVANICKMGFLCATFPIRASWAFMSAIFQLLGVDIGNLPDGYGSDWLDRQNSLPGSRGGR